MLFSIRGVLAKWLEHCPMEAAFPGSIPITLHIFSCYILVKMCQMAPPVYFIRFNISHGGVIKSRKDPGSIPAMDLLFLHSWFRMI